MSIEEEQLLAVVVEAGRRLWSGLRRGFVVAAPSMRGASEVANGPSMLLV